MGKGIRSYGHYFKEIIMDMLIDDNRPEPVLNVLGEPMGICCEQPITGFYRNGRCDAGPEDTRVHTVCIRATKEFLEYSKAGNLSVN